jgi:hypothetical protein
MSGDSRLFEVWHLTMTRETRVFSGKLFNPVAQVSPKAFV